MEAALDLDLTLVLVSKSCVSVVQITVSLIISHISRAVQFIASIT